MPNPIPGLDPRLRVYASVAFALIIVTGRDLSMLGAGLLLALGVAALAKLPPAPTARRLLIMDAFVVFMLLTLPFTVPGEALFQIGPLAASREGILRAAAIALKANAVMLIVLALLGTLEIATLGHALHHLRAPDKLVHLLLLTVRYIEVLQREYRRLRQAMTARAFTPRSNWHTWRSLGYLFAMLLVRSLERSERILAAMKCRGFDGRYHLLTHFTMSRPDWLFAGLFSGCLLGLIRLEWA